ncbi:MAG: AAA family ATPase [Gammaproteobacteria bacterium]|nr:AAA family ATPase [Gammaproteobacteria bacterium]
MPLFGHKIETTSDNFGDMVRGGCLLVDKTMMLKDLINGQQVSLVTRSRRSGKSLNMSMAYHFLSAEVAGKPTAGLFDEFSIAKEEGGQFLARHQGKYSVISITFKDTKEPSLEATMNQLRDLVQELYREHKKSLLSEYVDADDRALFQKYLDGSINNEQLQKSLRFLSEFLYKANDGKKVIILIDEYDSPLTHAYQHNFLDELSNFMRNMFSAALKGNPYLEKGLMTGILRVSKNELLSGLNNLKIYSLFDNRYSQYFGFTEGEVAELTERVGLSHSLEEVRQFYNGYLIGDTVIYNPWSLMNYLDEKRLAPYWVLTSGDHLLKKLFIGADDYTKDQMSQLMQGKVITGSISMKTSYEDLMESPDALWTLLLFSGYLTIVSQEQEDDDVKCELKIPNREILSQYKSIFKHWLKQAIGTSQYDSFLKNLLAGNVAEFTVALGKYLMDSLSFHDIGDRKENFYHGLVAGLIASIGESHWVDSNKESGYGRYDIMLTPKSGRGTRGIILEFKHAKKDQSLKKEATDALGQIDASKYSTELERCPHITHVLKVGLAFSGKNVLSVYNEETLATHQHTEVTWTKGCQRDALEDNDVRAFTKKKIQKKRKISLTESIEESESDSTALKKKVLSSSQINRFVSAWDRESDETLKAVLKESKEDFLKKNGQEFSQQVTVYGLDLVDVPGDGNCFFHALLAQLQLRHPDVLTMVLTTLGITSSREVTHMDLRHLAVNSLLRVAESGQLSAFIEEIDNYIADIARDRSWADGIVIPVLAKVLGVTVVLINSDGNKPTVIDGGSSRTVYLGYQVGVHFQSTTGEPNTQMIRDIPTRRSMTLRQSSVHVFFPPPSTSQSSLSSQKRGHGSEDRGDNKRQKLT